MVTAVSSTKIAQYASAFSDPQTAMVLASIAEGNTNAQLWQSTQPDNSLVYLLWDKGNNVFYLASTTLVPPATRELADLITTQIKEQALREKLAHFHVHALSSTLELIIPELFQPIILHPTCKRLYCLPGTKVSMRTPSIEVPVQYVQINQDFLAHEHYHNIQYVAAEIAAMWSSLNRFYTHGFGYAALIADTIICWCTTEYVSTSTCGIGIETDPAYQGKGIATATAMHVINHCLQCHITPYWECDCQNRASVRVAEKIGFEYIQERTFWSGTFLHM